MTLKHIFAIAVAVVAFASCSNDYEVDNLNGLTVSSSYVSLPLAGGANNVNITSNDAWELDTTGTVVKGKKWLEFSSLSGNAGESTLTIKAEATENGRSAEVKLKSGNLVQRINIIQGLPVATPATCAEVLAGPDAKTYMVTGTVTKISNTSYGNFYLADNTGEVYIYGTLDKNGKEKNFASLGIDEGDEVTVSGPKSTYGSTVELKNVTVNKITKSLVKVDSVYVGDKKSSNLPLEGGEATAYVTCKGGGLTVSIPEEAKSWLSMSALKQSGQSALITFKATKNDGGARSATVSFTSGKSTVTSTITQDGSIKEVNLGEFKASAEDQSQYRITALVSKVDAKGNFWIQDYTDLSGEIEAYKPSGNTKGIKVGDIVTVVGTHSSYKGVAQIGSPVVEKVKSVKAVSLGEFDNQADGTLVIIKGKVGEVKNDKFGNFYLEDKTGKVYVYGLFGYGAPKGTTDRQNFMKDHGIAAGHTITVVGPKTTYKGVSQLNGGYFVSAE